MSFSTTSKESLIEKSSLVTKEANDALQLE
jgi:hypothetical protein